ncbi:hypothetical protein C0214_21960 [Methylobacterium sp. DM1]|nr:hypothetical protein C0214_21960 [Methylobacterium sp. DM1]
MSEARASATEDGMNACRAERPTMHPVQTEAIAIRARRSLRSQADSPRARPAASGPPVGPAPAAPSRRASGFARIRR